MVSATLLASVTAKAGIDLTPTATEYISEGIKYQKLIFRAEKQRVEYDPPPGWSFRGSTDRLQFTPAKKRFADALIEAVPLAAPQPLDEKTAKALREQFLASLRADSQFVSVVSEEHNPILLDGNLSFETIVAYQLMGEKFVKSALFVNLLDTQLIFRLTARKDDFDALHSEFKRSMLSWRWVAPDSSSDETVASVSR
jgi:hypothetical protein